MFQQKSFKLVRVIASPFVADTPGSPENLKISQVRRDSMVIKWDPPEADGGRPITHYVVEMKDCTVNGDWTIYDQEVSQLIRESKRKLEQPVWQNCIRKLGLDQSVVLSMKLFELCILKFCFFLKKIVQS